MAVKQDLRSVSGDDDDDEVLRLKSNHLNTIRVGGQSRVTSSLRGIDLCFLILDSTFLDNISLPTICRFLELFPS